MSPAVYVRMHRPSSRFKILCVACSKEAFKTLKAALKSPHISALKAATVDQAVAMCVAEAVSVAVIDAESIRGQELSVVKALKAIKPLLPIILLEERKAARKVPMPEGVDALVSISSPKELFGMLNRVLPELTPSSKAG